LHNATRPLLVTQCMPSKPAQLCPFLHLCSPPAPDDDLVGSPIDDDRIFLATLDIDDVLR
jgi:hypothetical protein